MLTRLVLFGFHVCFLSLREASPSGGHGEPALMCMHSQGTDYMSVCLDAERGTRMLLSASMDHSGNEWVTAHSLEAITLLVRRDQRAKVG